MCIVNWFGSRSRERPVRIDHVADSSRRLFNKKTTDSIGGVVMRDEMSRGIKVFVFFFSFLFHTLVALRLESTRLRRRL